MIRGDRVHRVTFSESLAKHIVSITGDGYRVAPFDVILGSPLNSGERSPTNAYAIVANRNGRILRVALDRDVASFLGNDPSRSVFSCWLKPL